ncbi:MAG: 2'-5' RNA ligase family protein [Bacteroidota bacterium]
MNRYSLIIQPSPEVVAEVALLKNQLETAIGWYNSKNSLAHITINEFEAPTNELEKIKNHITSITDFLKENEVNFDSFNTFPNGAFFLAPDNNSKIFLKNVMKEIHKAFIYKVDVKSTEPHITIGRKILVKNLEIANQLFATPNVTFLCDRLALRVFNSERKQFDVIEEFIFKNKQKEGFQSSLF